MAVKALGILMFVLAGNAAFACPNFSGTYNQVMHQEDNRSTVIWTIKQNGCESYDNETQVVFKGGTKSDKNQFKRIVDGFKEYWEGNKLMDFQKDVNSEHCNTRGYLEQDQKKNLRYSWRFECPEPIGTSPWFTPETTKGWTGELYLRQ